MARPIEVTGRNSRFIILASLCVVVAALYFAREVLIPLALATLFAFLLAPLVSQFERLRLNRGVSTILVVLLAIALVAGLGYVVGRQFKQVLSELPQYQTQIATKIHKFREKAGPLGKVTKDVEQLGKAISGPASQPASQPATTQSATQPTAGIADQARDSSTTGLLLPKPPPELQPAKAPPPPTGPTRENPLPVSIVEPQPSPVKAILDYADTFLAPLTTTLLVIVFVIFMLLTREDLRDRIIRLVGHGRLNLTTQALDEAAKRITRYLVAQSLVNGCYAVAVAGGLWVIGRVFGHNDGPGGFPNVLLWGLLCGVLRFIPYVGIWIAMSAPLAVAFALFKGNGVFFGTIGMFVVYETVVSQFIEPFWYGSSTGMSGLAVLVAAVFWTWLWGPIGLLLSTPLTVCLVVIGKYVPQLQFLDILLGDEPVLPTPVRLYQRLIASDEEEATEVAAEELKKQPLDAVYDHVLIPALAMAESDHHRGRLDEHRYAFIRQSLRDIVEELGDEQRTKSVHEAAAQVEQAAKDAAPAPGQPAARAHLPEGCTVNVLCLPARGEADEIVCLMLAQVLDLRGYCTFTAGSATLASEMVEQVESHKADIVCVSAMPPAAVAHARYLCKRVHARFPEMKMAVGLWTAKGDLANAKRRIACSESVPVVATLVELQTHLDQLARPAILRGGPQAPLPDKDPAVAS